jgi:hypothetical protein
MGDLSTTTVSDLSAFAQFFMCCSSSLPLTKFRLKDRVIDAPTHHMDIRFKESLLNDTYKVRAERNSHILRHVTSLCRTSRVHTDIITKCIPEQYTDVEELTCGGMSRIYSAEPGVVIKTTDCSRGLGLYEYSAYMMLERDNFPIPSIEYVAMYGQYLIIILSRHSFSLSSLLLALARRASPADSGTLDAVLHNVRYLLHEFKQKDITYCDFSPDNIMIDANPETGIGRCILIDPQFVVRTSHLTLSMGRHWAENIDRVHFAYKIRALAIQEPQLMTIAHRVCTEFLGYVPSAKQTKRWILNVLPDGLRVAYDSARTVKI